MFVNIFFTLFFNIATNDLKNLSKKWRQTYKIKKNEIYLIFFILKANKYIFPKIY